MNEQIKQTIKDELSKLPTDRQSVINSFDWIETTKKIGEKYSFNENEIGKLQIEVLLVLVEMEYLSDLKINIENSLSTSRNQAENATREIEEQVFKPIAQKMESSVKSQITFNTPSWDETINFIISGGNYSYFVKK